MLLYVAIAIHVTLLPIFMHVEKSGITYALPNNECYQPTRLGLISH